MTTDDQTATLAPADENEAGTSTSGLTLGRLLIFIVAYNAERTIESVLKRIPINLADYYDVEVLIIDDSSQDATFHRSEAFRRSGQFPFTLTVLFNPVNQGYGGNQKIGFHYAIEKGFDWVALVHGDGQYAPECLPELMEAFTTAGADAVFGSRMLNRGGALKGGMPLYKFFGNKILSTFQNLLLGTRLSEFHSGYRLYRTQALAAVPFELNSNDFHFDTEIIIQFVLARLSIREVPIPTFYGDEVCHVNGLAYAWNVCLATLQARVQRYHIFYDRKFDCAIEPEKPQRQILSPLEQQQDRQIRQGSKVLVLGRLEEALRAQLTGRGCIVVEQEVDPAALKNVQVATYEYLLLADGGVTGERPEEFIPVLRQLCVESPDIIIILHVGNVAFCITRLLLLFGRFAYSRKGIINLRRHRLFTLRSLKKLFTQNGFEIISLIGLPVPYERFMHGTRLMHAALAAHYRLIRAWKAFFSYQFLLVTKPLPSLHYLLRQAQEVSEQRQREL